MFSVGLIGWGDRFLNGHAHANYGNIVPWGLWVAGYIYFIGLSAGAFLISSLVYVFNVRTFERIGRVALFTALVTLLMALLMIWPDLGHMWRAWHVLAYPNFKSPMAWMIWLYSLYGAILCAELWFLLRRDLITSGTNSGRAARVYRFLTLGSTDTSDESGARDRRVVRTLAMVGIPVAIMFHGGVGTLFGVIAARPHWHGGLFPILFLLSALASGGALLTFIAAVFQEGAEGRSAIVLSLGRLVMMLLLLDLLFQLAEMLVAFYSNVPAEVAGLTLMISGPFWWVFWGCQIGIGTLIPLWLLLSRHSRTKPALVGLAGLLVALGFLAVRLNIVIPGLAIEEIRGLSTAIASPRMTMLYVPSGTEWLLLSGVLGLGLLLFGLGERWLPAEQEHARDTGGARSLMTEV
jgi:molybdopterin-containing oxidoreductase family membrane subunit